MYSRTVQGTEQSQSGPSDPHSTASFLRQSPDLSRSKAFWEFAQATSRVLSDTVYTVPPKITLFQLSGPWGLTGICCGGWTVTVVIGVDTQVRPEAGDSKMGRWRACCLGTFSAQQLGSKTVNDLFLFF